MELPGLPGFQRMKAMAKHRIHSIEFKRHIAQDFIAGETLHALASRHDISRSLIRIWVRKFEAGAFDDDARAADLLQDYEAKIAALERMVGRQALEIEFLKGALKSAPRPRSETTSVIAGRAVPPSRKDGGSLACPAPPSTPRCPHVSMTPRLSTACRRSAASSRLTATGASVPRFVITALSSTTRRSAD